MFSGYFPVTRRVLTPSHPPPPYHYFRSRLSPFYSGIGLTGNTIVHYHLPPPPIPALAVLLPSTWSPGPSSTTQPRSASLFLHSRPPSGCPPCTTLNVASVPIEPRGYYLLGSVLPLPLLKPPAPPLPALTCGLVPTGSEGGRVSSPCPPVLLRCDSSSPSPVPPYLLVYYGVFNNITVGPLLPKLRTIKPNYMGFLRFKKTQERRFEFGVVEENQNRVPSALWSIHDSSQNPVTTYDNYNFKGFSKIVFPYALWCFHVFSKNPATTPKLSKIGCLPGITPQLSKQS